MNPELPKIYSPDEISAIPEELRKELNIAPAIPKSEIEADLSDIPPEVLAQIRAISSSNILGEEPSGFSWAALVYGPFYYGAMKDWLFVFLSSIASLLVYTIPLLIPLAFFARRRAWHSKKWDTEDQFWQSQKLWDRSAVFGAILAVIALYFASQYVFSLLSSNFGTTDPNTLLKQVQSQYQDN